MKYRTCTVDDIDIEEIMYISNIWIMCDGNWKIRKIIRSHQFILASINIKLLASGVLVFKIYRQLISAIGVACAWRNNHISDIAFVHRIAVDNVIWRITRTNRLA